MEQKIEKKITEKGIKLRKDDKVICGLTFAELEEITNTVKHKQIEALKSKN